MDADVSPTEHSLVELEYNLVTLTVAFISWRLRWFELSMVFRTAHRTTPCYRLFSLFCSI